MTVIWLMLAVVFMLSVLSRYFSTPVYLGPTYIRSSRLLTLGIMASLVLVAGLRKNIGDTYYYMHSYSTGDFRLNQIQLEGDFGFNFLQALLHFISDDPQLLIFTTALFTNIFIVLVLRQYSRMIEVSLYVYIASGMFTISMNGIRQCLAASIVFLATKYILNGDWKKYFLIVLIASTFHNTALILIPIYFIVRREAWTKMTFLMLGMAVILTFGFQQFSDVIFRAIDDTHYSGYKDFAEGGASFIRVIVNGAPVVIAYLGRHRLRELWPNSDYIVNLSLLSCVFIIIATQNWIFARFNIYFGLYNLILISWLVHLFVKKDRKLIYLGLLLCYLAYFYYEQVISLGILYKSDYITW
ncbi:EpsG family protein [Paenibacillus spongiae]|uniref:EpsG family protein n=1 Tax=Paenibacillus spongiae TaxID=2909671 RepID=A0ABY5SFN4_9BACL|nr:EpsG family protein [Paenibacillus spongiae]UVI31525.1 EpsG family protein [Paenibacillus spongiae]